MFTGGILGVIALVIGFIVSFQALPVIIKVSKLKNLVDKPDGERKLHKEVVPNLGGVGIFAGFIIAYGILSGFSLPPYFPALVASLVILFFIGIKDDILMISPYKKLAGQILAACIIVFAGNVKLTGLDGLFGIYTFPWFTGELFSIAAIIFIINAYNLIDGVDGLAGMLAIVTAYVFGLWFLVGGHYAETILCFALSGALIGFMFHNFEPARIFMGDTGSMMIGFLIAVAGFRLVQLNPVTDGLVLNAPAIFIFSVMIIPVFDSLRLIVVRLSKGISPLRADRNHIHHVLQRIGLKHYQVALTLSLINGSIVSTSLLIQGWNVYLYLFMVLVMATAIVPFVIVAKQFLVRAFPGRTQTHHNGYFPDNILLSEIMNDINQDRSKAEAQFTKKKEKNKEKVLQA